MGIFRSHFFPFFLSSIMKVLTMSDVETTFRTSTETPCGDQSEGEKNVVVNGYYDAMYLYGQAINSTANEVDQSDYDV